MAEQNFCQGCNQKHRCEDVYRRLGGAKGSSIASKVVIAFLLPIVVFIACLAAFGEILSKKTGSKEIQTTLGFLLALSATFILVLVIKAVNRHPGKNG